MVVTGGGVGSVGVAKVGPFLLADRPSEIERPIRKPFGFDTVRWSSPSCSEDAERARRSRGLGVTVGEWGGLRGGIGREGKEGFGDEAGRDSSDFFRPNAGLLGGEAGWSEVEVSSPRVGRQEIGRGRGSDVNEVSAVGMLCRSLMPSSSKSTAW